MAAATRPGQRVSSAPTALSSSSSLSSPPTSTSTSAAAARPPRRCTHPTIALCLEAGLKSGPRRCCACRDHRTAGRLSLAERLRPYCTGCQAIWAVAPEDQLPREWKLGPHICDHGEIGKKCIFAANVGRCCVCTDERTAVATGGEEGLSSREKRLETYCGSCRAGWAAVPLANCPREWKLKCPHGRAWAWEVSSLGTTGARTGPCCCVCRDSARGTRHPQRDKAACLKRFCAGCRRHWRQMPDDACPPEWGPLTTKGCTHGGLSLHCNTAGGDRCCACRDSRTAVMIKAERIKTYCGQCRMTFTIMPEFQCPPEWHFGGLRPGPAVAQPPRSEAQCATHPVVRCGEGAAAAATETGAKAECCACRDMEKKGTVSKRASAYCPSCAKHWSIQPASAWPFSVSTTDDWGPSKGLFPLLKLGPDGKKLEPQVSFPAETPPTMHMFEEGPRKGEPRLGKNNPLNQPARTLPSSPPASPNGHSAATTGAANFAWQRENIGLSQLTTSAPGGAGRGLEGADSWQPVLPSGQDSVRNSTPRTPSSATKSDESQSATKNRTSWVQHPDEQGPLRGRTPKFSVPAKVSPPAVAPAPDIRPPDKARGPVVETPRRGSGLSADERWRMTDQEGLRYGAPRFVVGLDGTITE